MALKCAIVGLPNVGKSTLFNALTNARVDAANFPFCTIEPNTGVVAVPDLRLQAISEIVQPKRIVPTTVEFVDIAGLVQGASKGEGLGNTFLANIRDTQAVVQVVRCFDSSEITHVNNHIDPVADAETINTELLLADIDTLQKQIDKRKRLASSGNKQMQLELEQLNQLMNWLNEGKPARLVAQDTIDEELFDSLFLLSAKPLTYLANVDEDSVQGNQFTQQLQEYADAQQSELVIVCNKLEAEIAQLPEEEKAFFLEELGIEQPGLDQLIQAAYRLLGLQTFFTAGVQEVRAWTYKQQATAPQAAAVIHTDFEKGFIRAEVISYQDYIEYKGEAGAKDAGKWRLEGKEYQVKDGDVIFFRFNT